MGRISIGDWRVGYGDMKGRTERKSETLSKDQIAQFEKEHRACVTRAVIDQGRRTRLGRTVISNDF